MDLDDQKQLNLPRYLAESDNLECAWILRDKSRDPERSLSIETYHFHSQRWPKDSGPEQGKLWQHKLVLYRPDLISAQKALLFVNGGVCHPVVKENNPQVQVLDFARLASLSKALVVDLQDVPNQYLTFEDALPRKGDRLYAYSWSRFLEDPVKNAYWPLSLPMTKSIIKAMDVIQGLMRQEYFIPIDHFVVAGLSKRGLATWLAALHDERIAAIIPMVIDALNTQKIMKHIHASFNESWPEAFTDFIKEKIPEKMHTKAFEQLMKMEDPLAYLRDDFPFYKKRLSIPKYLISGSGDDFFPPDCLKLYLDQLPGETRLRFLPNQGHFIDLSLVEEVLLNYFRAFLKGVSLPRVEWRMASEPHRIGQVFTEKQPKSVKLWEAENRDARDFRFNSGIRYREKNVVGVYREGYYHYAIQVSLPSQGFKVHFVELRFEDKEGDSIVLTTPSFII